MADVAKQAGCSVKTLYNHFPTKRDLMLFIYFRSVAPLQEEGQHLLDDGSSPLEVAKFVISKFAKYVSNNRTLTAAAVAALHDQKLEYPEPGDHDLPENRGLPVLVAILADLIDIGREQGGIAAGPSSFELATYHVMGLMVAATMHAELTENQLVELVLSQFLPALTASQSHHGPGAGDHYQSDTAAELNQAE